MVLSIELYYLKVPAAKNFLFESLHINRNRGQFLNLFYIIASKASAVNFLLTESVNLSFLLTKQALTISVSTQAVSIT